MKSYKLIISLIAVSIFGLSACKTLPPPHHQGGGHRDEIVIAHGDKRDEIRVGKKAQPQPQVVLQVQPDKRKVDPKKVLADPKKKVDPKKAVAPKKAVDPKKAVAPKKPVAPKKDDKKEDDKKKH